MTESDRDRRIEEELQRRERNVRGERAAARPQAPEPARTPPAPGRQAGLAAGPAPQAPDVEALFHRLEAQLDDMEGRVTAGIDAVTGTVASVMEVAATGGGAPALSPGREGGGRRRQRLGAGPRRSGRPPEPDPPARAKGAPGRRGSCWRSRSPPRLRSSPSGASTSSGPADPTAGWRDHVWERCGPELRDCVLRAERQGKAMLCQVFDPDPELP